MIIVIMKWIKKMNELGVQEYNSEKLIDNDSLIKRAIRNVEDDGIVFIWVYG